MLQVTKHPMLWNLPCPTGYLIGEPVSDYRIDSTTKLHHLISSEGLLEVQLRHLVAGVQPDSALRQGTNKDKLQRETQAAQIK